MRSIAVHGKGTNKYDNVRIGMNSRLDTMQAHVLIEKMKLIESEILLRQEVATKYITQVENKSILPSTRKIFYLHGHNSLLRSMMNIQEIN